MSLIRGDCVEVMAGMEADSVDSLCTDPPYGLEFMGKDWDRLDGNFSKPGIGERQTAWPSYGGDPFAGYNPTCATCGGRLRGSRRCECEAPDWRIKGQLLDGFRRQDNPADVGRDDVFGRTSARAPEYRAGLAMQEWHHAWAIEAFRILKPGGHLLAFGGTRTYHRLACALEDAGFEIRDCVCWLYGSGFPKSLSPYRSMLSTLCPSTEHARRAVRISAWHPVESLAARGPTALALAETLPEGGVALLIRTGQEDGTCGRMAISASVLESIGMTLSTESSWGNCSAVLLDGMSMSITATVTGLTIDPRILNCLRSAPTPLSIIQGESRPDGCVCDAWPVAESLSDDDWKWSAIPLLIAPESATGRLAPLEPLGSALKPAFEPIVVARKPLAGTVAANVMAHGTGALNVDGCRVAAGSRPRRVNERGHGEGSTYGGGLTGDLHGSRALGETLLGRWPANVALDEEAAAMLDEQSGESVSRVGKPRGTAKKGLFANSEWNAVGTEHDDAGGASRFFYVAKASRAERNAGLDGFEPQQSSKLGAGLRSSVGASAVAHGLVEGTTSSEDRRAANHHPTVKPVALMRWLVRLVTPPGGIVLDPFVGSGTTGIACALEGFDFIGIERDPMYLKIAEARIRFWAEHGDDGLRIVRDREAAETKREAIADSGQTDIFAMLDLTDSGQDD